MTSFRIPRWLYVLTVGIVLMSVSSCSGGYRAETCKYLTEKMLNHKTIDQDDYKLMLEQYDYILDYMVAKLSKIEELLTASDRAEAFRKLRGDQDYMERFTYMMTIGSELYRAEVNSLLDLANKSRYYAVNQRVNEMALLTEAINNSLAGL